MSKKLLFLLPLFFHLSLFSQSYYTSDYTWGEDPFAIVCPDSLLNEAEVNLMQKMVAEFTYNDDDFIERDLYHRVTYLGSDEAIEDNNRIYLPIANDEILEISKARAINPKGKVIELSDEDINSAEDENGNITYYYAFKGLEIGSIIEYFFIQTIPAEYSGTRIIMQNDIIQLNSSIHLVAPWNLVFKYKGYNGFGELEKDTSDYNFNHWVKHFDFIPKFKFENQSFYSINAMQMVYKLDENIIEGEKDIINYEYMANYIIKNNTIPEKKDKKILSKWLKESNAKEEKTKEAQLRKFEVYLKKNNAILDVSSPDLKDLQFIDENKILNPLGFIKSVALASEELDINYEIVMTCNRTNQLFDSSFQAYNFLDHYLLYFPEINKYMDPNDSYGSLGIISPYYQDNYGVFFKKFKSGKLVMANSEIRFIEGTLADESHHDMFMDIVMNDDFTHLDVSLNTISTGQFAAGVQPYYDILEPEDIDETNKAQVTWIAESIEVKDVNVENSGFSQLGVKPFLLNSNYSVSEFISKARDKYIIEIGMLIGPQTEMYQDTKRTMPVDSDFRKYYHRKLNFTIPDGYKVENLESINIDKSASDENGVYATFSSTYKIDNNILKINCIEYYKKVFYKVSEYEDYRSIINSAADFNKIVIVLEKL